MKSAVSFRKKWAPLIPECKCGSGCQGGCCGPILGREAEVKEIFRFLRDRHIEPEHIVVGESIRCGFLRATGCAIYEVRPLICRIFGVGPLVVEKLRCPFLPNAPVMDMNLYLNMMDEYERLGALLPIEDRAEWENWLAEAVNERPHS
jgi:hypothetical protein